MLGFVSNITWIDCVAGNNVANGYNSASLNAVGTAEDSVVNAGSYQNTFTESGNGAARTTGEGSIMTVGENTDINARQDLAAKAMTGVSSCFLLCQSALMLLKRARIP